MYYEENFRDMVTNSNSNVKRESTGTSATGYQETGFMGSTYGTDTVYMEETGVNYGASMYADVSSKYDITGTSILSRISTNSAYIQVTITDEEWSSVGSPVHRHPCAGGCF